MIIHGFYSAEYETLVQEIEILRKDKENLEEMVDELQELVIHIFILKIIFFLFLGECDEYRCMKIKH